MSISNFLSEYLVFLVKYMILGSHRGVLGATCRATWEWTASSGADKAEGWPPRKGLGRGAPHIHPKGPPQGNRQGNIIAL